LLRFPSISTPRRQLRGIVRSVKVSLDRDATQALLKQVPAATTQINDVLLTALNNHHMGGSQFHLIDLGGHGREDLSEGGSLPYRRLVHYRLPRPPRYQWSHQPR